MCTQYACGRLELTLHPPPPVRAQGERRGRRMHPSVKRRLVSFFAAANSRLAAVTGQDWAWMDPESGGMASLPPSAYMGGVPARAPGQVQHAAALLPPAALPALPAPAPQKQGSGGSSGSSGASISLSASAGAAVPVADAV